MSWESTCCTELCVITGDDVGECWSLKSVSLLFTTLSSDWIYSVEEFSLVYVDGEDTGNCCCGASRGSSSEEDLGDDCDPSIVGCWLCAF